ncbi:MAG: MmgE/PrpD family protein [Betaproteobacteria bacterium]
MRETVARHVAGSPAAKVSRHARLLLLDTLGCALAGRRAPEVSRLEQSLADLEGGDFRCPQGRPLSVRAAGQILAIAPTWDEACEGHAYAHGRPGIPAIAALLPLALHQKRTLGAFIGALVMGYEIGARAGGWLRVPKGIHVDGNWPGIGVAAAVSRLAGGDVLRAIDIAACQLPYSLYLPVRWGLTVRNTYLAHSAMLGLDAALAAQAGFGAPQDALSHYAEHFCQADEQPLPGAGEDLILGAYFKPFAAVRHVHYGAIAARALRNGLDVSSVKEIELSVYEEAMTYCGNRDPKTPLAAQFSLSFGIATMLRFGELEPACYDEPRFSDPEVRRLEKLVRIAPDRELTTRRRRGARLTIDGRVAETPDSHPDLMLDEAGVIAKFARNAPDARGFGEALLSAPQDTPFEKLWGML